MISIITAIHNGLHVNRLFYESLEKYTLSPYELIIIDNNSTDGSREYFIQQGAKVIQNKENYSYPYCQNQGIDVAKGEWLAFLNNDIVVGKNWDLRLIMTAELNGLEVITPCGIERLETKSATKKARRRWKRIKTWVSFTRGKSQASLEKMVEKMYGNWEEFSEKRWKEFDNQVTEGFIGNTVLIKRSAIEKIGLWDERIQAADFDLYIRVKKRSMEEGDIKPVHIALGVFNHHFIRLTVGSGPPEFADKEKLIRLEEKYTEKELKLYLKDNVST